MPQQKDFKRIVRSRMQKTGESYTAARHQITSSRKSSSATPERRPDYTSLAGMSDETIEKPTGRNWAQWVELLDAWGAAQKPHRDIAAYVSSIGVPSWWTQAVTVGYERIRGLREIGQRRDGTWEVSRSRTFNVPLTRLYETCSDEKIRKRWLKGSKFEIRKTISEKSIRFGADDGTLLQFYFTAKGEAKSQLAIQHTKLGSKEETARLKSYWSDRLDELQKILEEKSPR